jgi:hypothetical protein
MNENLDYKPDPINTAFACIDLITVASHLGNSETKPFITCATAAINNISAFSSQKHHAIEELADAEWNIGMRDLKYSDSPMIEARHEAEQGNLEKAYKIISGFGETLYVNHKEAGYELLFDDAIKRSDLKAAVYFAERPPSRIYARDLTMWRRIAELQIHAGNRKSASMSYSKSSEALDQVISEKTISSAEIAQVLQLGNSMLRNGINHQGKHILMLAQSLADKGRTDEDKIKSLIFIASAFMQNEMFSNAKLAIKQAYSDAHRYDTTQPFGEMRKVELLTDIGNALIAISPKGSAPNSMLH